jgi:hypothetical protein
MAGGRFRYALQPVALQRQWAVDDVQRELASANAALTPLRAACDALHAQVAHGELQWRDLGDGARLVSVDQFALVSRYLADRRARLMTARRELEQQQRECARLVEQLVAAKRGLDAVEEHKARMWTRFVQLRMSGEFKVADEQWNVLQAGMAEHGN